MTNYLIIENDEVVNFIVADTAEIAAEVTGLEVIESIGTEPGMHWKRIDNVWTAPVVEETPSE
jgi:hypothetical protein